MISLSKSVGKNGVNLALDLRKVQIALLQLNLLSTSDFIQECLNCSFVQPVDGVKQKVIANNVEIDGELSTIATGKFSIAEEHLRATLFAIEQFQQGLSTISTIDAKIDPRGKTLKALNRALDERPLNPLENFSEASTNVQAEGDKVSIVLNHAGQQKTKALSIIDCRNYIISNYNWNGITKLMKFVYQSNNDIYRLPTNLSGTKSDDVLLIPSQALVYVVKLQAQHQIKTIGLNSGKLDLILRGVDGKPGNTFIQKIIKAKGKASYFSEHKNKSFINTDTNESIPIPDLKAEETTLYDFFRALAQVRNGLWSDRLGVVNMLGLRRVLDKKTSTHYNDTLAVCWKEEDGTKRVELNIATTEPGNRVIRRQLMPQTLTVVPGFHNIRQPAGRTRNAVIQSANEGGLVFEVGDTTMNFHQGSNNFAYPGSTRNAKKYWLSAFGVTQAMQTGMPEGVLDERSLLELNLVFSEIYVLLSRYGLGGKKAPYQNLKTLAESEAIVNNGIEGNSIKLQQGSKTKKVDINHARQWLLDFWFPKRKTGGRKQIGAILLAISDFDLKEVSEWESLSKSKILELITAEHVQAIVDTQIKYCSKISEIDGLAGFNFVKMISGIRQSRAAAIEDKESLDSLFERLQDYPLKNLTSLVRKFKTFMQINTDLQRQRVLDNTQFDETNNIDVVENSTVGGYSAGCQVIYDAEVFYTFWTKLLKRASASGQERWYYTLIDATKMKKLE